MSADVFGTEPMQVDDSTFVPPTTPSRSMTDQTFEDECDDLGRIVFPGDGNDRVKHALDLVWAIVCGALEKRNEKDLATLDQFQDNVKRKGEPEFIDLLRDMARRDDWHELFKNGDFPRCIRHCVF